MSVTDSNLIHVFQDFISPFYIFLKPFSQINYKIIEETFEPKNITITSKIFIGIGKIKKEKYKISINIIDDAIASIEIHSHNSQIKAVCESV
jgi:hypothetical protein